VALFGILKAGGAYVALDPAYPQRRLEAMAAAAGLTLILSRRGLADAVPGSAAHVICLDRDWDLFSDEDPSPLAEDPPARALVYIVFTSGSSGAPKGVMAEHGSLGLRIDSLREMYGFGPGDRVLQFCSLSFDASIEEIFPPLTAGAALVQHPAASELTPANLLDEVERLEVDSLHVPPVYWHALVEHLEEADRPVPRRVRRFITGGEAPSPQMSAIWARRSEHPTRMWNGYGPTEATFGCSTHEPRLDAEELASLERLSIGRPWPHNRLYVRAADLALLPVGVPGEICCGSEILTRGYLDRPGHTAERFVPDPDALRPGARMYRTGDLGRFLADGRLDFLGRTDLQIKVRGVRIEPEEVEAGLAEHPRVAAAAVVLHGDGDGACLVGYVSVRGGVPPSDEALRDHLLLRLPPPMVPAAFVVLDELPVSPNGKVDREALPPPGPLAERPLVEPETETERALMEIWQRVLGREKLGVTDDFFVLGGQSLLAVRLMAQIEKRFGRRLPLATLLERRSVRRMAALIDDPQAELPWQPLVALDERGDQPPLFCIHPVGGEVMCYLPLAERLGGERPVYGLQAPGLRATTDSPSIEALARGYLAEVRRVQPQGPYHLLGWSFGAFVAYEMGRGLKAAGEKVGGLFLLDTWAPLFDTPPEDEDLQMLVDLARNRAHHAGRPFPELLLGELSRLDGEERLERYLALLKEHDLIPEDVGVPLARNIVRGYRVRRRIVEAYRPGPYDGEVTLLVASEPEDPQHLARLEAAGLDPADRTLGWSQLTPLPVKVLTVVGNHETLCEEPHVANLAAQLRSALERQPAGVGA
jgi:aspartate racemase